MGEKSTSCDVHADTSEFEVSYLNEFRTGPEIRTNNNPKENDLDMLTLSALWDAVRVFWKRYQVQVLHFGGRACKRFKSLQIPL